MGVCQHDQSSTSSKDAKHSSARLFRGGWGVWSGTMSRLGDPLTASNDAGLRGILTWGKRQSHPASLGASCPRWTLGRHGVHLQGEHSAAGNAMLWRPDQCSAFKGQCHLSVAGNLLCTGLGSCCSGGAFPLRSSARAQRAVCLLVACYGERQPVQGLVEAITCGRASLLH